MRRLFFIILIFWEGPQNLLGLLCMIFLALFKQIEKIDFERNRIFIKVKPIAVSLGLFIFWSSWDDKFIKITDKNKSHEYGHSIQSRLFGPFYLLVIGIPSMTRVIYGLIYYLIKNERWEGYYKGYPENWADILGESG